MDAWTAEERDKDFHVVEYSDQRRLRNAGVYQDLEAERKAVAITLEIMENCQAECTQWRKGSSARAVTAR